MAQQNAQPGALVRNPIRITAVHRGQMLMDQVFQHTPIRIGRLLDNDVVLPFDFASRYHAEIRFDGERWTAIDLGSKNGLMIDPTTRATEIQLENNSSFIVQEVTITLTFETAAEVARDFSSLRESVREAPTQAASHESIDLQRARSMDLPRFSAESSMRDYAEPSKTKPPMADIDINSMFFPRTR